jgi:hypothetical protein
MTYDEWLRLTETERDDIHFRQWNVYARDGILIAFTAATRLAMHSPFKIYDIRIGTYHGGEYTLEPYVSQEDYHSCPPMLAQKFEGFRVIWQPIGVFCHAPAENGTFDGTWVEDCAEPDSEFSITTLPVPPLVKVEGRCLPDRESMHISDIWTDVGKCLMFRAIVPNSGRHTIHTMHLVGEDDCEHYIQHIEKWKRRLAT